MERKLERLSAKLAFFFIASKHLPRAVKGSYSALGYSRPRNPYHRYEVAARGLRPKQFRSLNMAFRPSYFRQGRSWQR